MKQPAAGGRHQVKAGADSSGRLPEERHVVGIAAEGGDVVSDPTECRSLIGQSIVAARSVSGVFECKCAVREEPERAEAVVGGHDDGVLLAGKPLAVARGKVRGRCPKVTAMKPDHDRPSGRPRGGCPNVERQAVLAACGGRASALGADRRRHCRVQRDRRPRRSRLRGSPPKIADRRRRVRHAKVAACSAAKKPLGSSVCCCRHART